MSKRKPPSNRALWHPAYWPSWCVVSLLFLLSRLPASCKRRCGEGIGRWLSRRLSSRARVVDANLQACMPQLSDDKRAQLVTQSFVSCTRGMFESLDAWWGDLGERQRQVEVQGLEHLREAMARNRGVLMIGGHYSILDLALPLVGQYLSKPGYMYRPNNSAVIDRMIERGRRRHFDIQPFTKRQLREMMAFLAEGGQVWYGCDQDFGKKTDVFATFFGVETGCISTPTFIARESGATVLCVSHVRKPCGGYRVAFSPILDDFGRCPHQDAQRWNRFIEDTVRQFPDQYLWLHKRFKTRPAGADAIY
ncbi:lysophospholipid acyltransferase family protein [Marinobacter sp. SS21]|uniref:lysophospholipid acyltransferase family protein n=1 Tax=Marinobacter sp. SS21 TaxID=2979460 RepID=UPI00232B77D4|nr:lysophospholipid acyltransferase family protein [Marinobacter sp. SS21]MDC0662388.1 lysophospholipid acyltransferase family protein [Marinobacter sp. SS21]